MPWCDDCSRYWSPLSMKSGTCPTCGRQLEVLTQPEDHPKVPWHFTVLLVGLCVYLAYRFWQLGVWLVHKL
jgi:C4-type Zn-finger protein